MSHNSHGGLRPTFAALNMTPPDNRLVGNTHQPQYFYIYIACYLYLEISLNAYTCRPFRAW